MTVFWDIEACRLVEIIRYLAVVTAIIRAIIAPMMEQQASQTQVSFNQSIQRNIPEDNFKYFYNKYNIRLYMFNTSSKVSRNHSVY